MTLTETGASELNLDVLLNVPLSLSVEVGRTSMTIGELLETREGSVVELTRLVDEPLDIYVNDAQVARGMVVMQEERFGIQITEIISQKDRASQLRVQGDDEAAE